MVTLGISPWGLPSMGAPRPRMSNTPMLVYRRAGVNLRGGSSQLAAQPRASHAFRVGYHIPTARNDAAASASAPRT